MNGVDPGCGWGLTKPLRAVLIDLDDTIYPQSSYLAGAWDAVVAAAVSAGLQDAQRFRNALHEEQELGSDRGGLIDRALAAVGSAIPVRPLVGAFTLYRPSTLETYANIRILLGALSELVAVVIVTDGAPTTQRAKLDALALPERVDVVMSDLIGGRATRKPCADPFLQALARAGARADEAVMIGDRPEKDIAGSLAVGIGAAVRVMTGEHAGAPDVAGTSAVYATAAEPLQLLLYSAQSTSSLLTAC